MKTRIKKKILKDYKTYTNIISKAMKGEQVTERESHFGLRYSSTQLNKARK